MTDLHIPESNVKARTTFLKADIKRKGWKIKEVAARWGITPRRMSQILKNPTYMHIDAIYGLPNCPGQPN